MVREEGSFVNSSVAQCRELKSGLQAKAEITWRQQQLLQAFQLLPARERLQGSSGRKKHFDVLLDLLDAIRIESHS